jgi:hypothetical protein
MTAVDNFARHWRRGTLSSIELPLDSPFIVLRGGPGEILLWQAQQAASRARLIRYKKTA